MLLAAASIVGIAALSASVLLQRSRANAFAAKLEHRETTLNTILHAEKDLRVIHMKAADTVNGPGIQFFWNEKHRSGLAHAFRLPPAPANHSYQLWVIADGKPASVKVFDSDPDGHAMVEGLALPPTSRGVTAVYLTVEPAGGSPTPTTEPILKGTVPATY
jgi:anti-sigma-K factor RskA